MDVLQAFNEALGWYSWNRVTQCSGYQYALITSLLSPNTPERACQEIYQRLQSFTTRQGYPARRAEILLYLASYLVERGDCERAVVLLKQAIQTFTELADDQGLFIAFWLIHTLKHTAGSNANDFHWGRLAHDRCIHAHGEATRLRNTDAANWYADRIVDLSASLLQTPLGAYGWMNPFDDSCGDPLLKQSRTEIEHLIDVGETEQARAKMAYTLRLTESSASTAQMEAYTMCGVFLAILDSTPAPAIHHLEIAKTRCPQCGHHQMMIHWILGLIQQRDPALTSRAAQNMQRSIREARDLALAEDHHNHADRKNWYLWHAQAMERVLRQQATGWF